MTEMYEMDEKNRATQNTDVMYCMKTNGYISKKEADALGVWRLSARIYDLREQGNEIQTIMTEGITRHGRKSRYARYFLVKAV